MSDRDALIRAICAHPHEDTPRLAFADWLAENGEPELAQFVRSSIAGKWPAYRYGYRDGDVFPWLWCPRIPGVMVAFHRGFVDEVRLPLAVFLEHAAELFGSHPITRVVLTDKRPWEMASGVSWSWFTWQGLDDIDTLPVHLFNLLGRRSLESGYDTGRIRYLTREDAENDLSAACVSLGRERAGLPALEPADVTS